MPKIIKHGDRWPRLEEDWVGRKFTCGNCGCVFEICEGDKFSRSRIPGILTKIINRPDRENGTECNIEMKCPECSNKIGVNWSR